MIEYMIVIAGSLLTILGIGFFVISYNQNAERWLDQDAYCSVHEGANIDACNTIATNSKVMVYLLVGFSIGIIVFGLTFEKLFEDKLSKPNNEVKKVDKQ